MNHTELHRSLTALFAFASLACGSESTVEPGSDAGARDAAMRDDAQGSFDSGPMIDAGPPPLYCPALPAPEAPPNCPDNPKVVEIAADAAEELSGDRTWSCNNTYHLSHHVFVTGGTLTIEPGTRITGENDSALVITRGARLNAVGHPSAPIVFTSSKAEGDRAPGDWGGLVLLGSAPINTTGVTEGEEPLPTGSNVIEGLPASENRGVYGGTNAAHDCGTLRHARIEFAGHLVGQDNELNGLTLGGCGTETEVEFVQVHMGLDDGFEVFGGAPNLRFIVASGIDDDGLDFDLGFSGTIQFAVVDRLGLATVGSSDPNGIESDNHPNAFESAPRTNPRVYNVTLIGEAQQTGGAGMVLRRGTWGTISNALVVDWPLAGVNVRDEASIGAVGDQLRVRNSIFFDVGSDDAHAFAYGRADSLNYETALLDSALMNRQVDPMLGDVSNSAPNYVPPSTSPAVSGGEAPPAPLQTQATFVGAFGPGCPDWTNGWTSYAVE